LNWRKLNPPYLPLPRRRTGGFRDGEKTDDKRILVVPISFQNSSEIKKVRVLLFDKSGSLGVQKKIKGRGKIIKI